MNIPSYAADNRLIFDLGMNNGDDTAFYLDRGFKVVAIEANEVLCEKARERFKTALDEGRLHILHAAIAEKEGVASFYINLDNDHWISLDTNWATRDATRTREAQVRCVTLDQLFDEFGVPHYLKIDVEGADEIVFQQLRGRSTLPRYVSVEDCRFGFRYLETLAACGYNGFKLLDQSTVPQIVDRITGRRFPLGSSGPFGEELPGEWLPYGEMTDLYSATVRDRAGNRLAPRSQWWDIHCTAVGAN
jgi:FkbM family methyltransferase